MLQTEILKRLLTTILLILLLAGCNQAEPTAQAGPPADAPPEDRPPPPDGQEGDPNRPPPPDGENGERPPRPEDFEEGERPPRPEDEQGPALEVTPLDEAQPQTGDAELPSSASSADCPVDLEVVAALYPGVSYDCVDGIFRIETPTGLPDHEIMHGITAWILRVPLPVDYTGASAWMLPTQPIWTTSLNPTQARGPIAVAVNGVPIYHFDKRPDANLDPASYVYDARNDTVLEGELDHCGGHAGQGEDYHYHLAPVCLLDNHDLEQPIAFTLGGARIFYGTGADDYYGEGRYNDVNNLPSEPLSDCNGVQLEDGSWVYYTTQQPPYTVGCHHEEVDWALQQEPRQMRDLGEFGKDASELISLTLDGEVRTLLFETNDGGQSAVVYYPSNQGENCWRFEFRNDPSVEVTPEVHCRQ